MLFWRRCTGPGLESEANHEKSQQTTGECGEKKKTTWPLVDVRPANQSAGSTEKSDLGSEILAAPRKAPLTLGPGKGVSFQTERCDNVELAHQLHFGIL
jgi:hypothetical protein